MTANEQAQWPLDPSPMWEAWWRARGFPAPLSGDVTQTIKTSLVRSAEQRPERLVAGARAPRRDPEANGAALRRLRSALEDA
jgi:hypothetical protein